MYIIAMSHTQTGDQKEYNILSCFNTNLVRINYNFMTVHYTWKSHINMQHRWTEINSYTLYYVHKKMEIIKFNAANST